MIRNKRHPKAKLLGFRFFFPVGVTYITIEDNEPCFHYPEYAIEDVITLANDPRYTEWVDPIIVRLYEKLSANTEGGL